MKKIIALILAFAIAVLPNTFVFAQNGFDNETGLDVFPLLDKDASASVKSLFTKAIENNRALHKGLNILGADSITEEGASVNLKALYVQNSYLDSFVPENCTWTVDSDAITYVTEDDGTFTVSGKFNGEADIFLTAVIDGEDYEETLTIDVSGQSEGYTLSFDKNTEDDVTNMPMAQRAKGAEEFPYIYPRRDTFRFVGWTLTNDGTPVEHVDVKNDTTVYAVWEKATGFDFNRPMNNEGFTVVNGSDVLADGGSLSFTADAGAMVKSPVLDVLASDVSALLVNMESASYGANALLTLTLNTTEDTYIFEKNISSEDMVTYDFNLPEIYGTINSFELAVNGIADGTKISIDDIRFTSKGILIYDANTDAVVANMPSNIRDESEIVDGKVTVSSVVPTRQGYSFICWTASPDSKLPVSGKIAASSNNSVTLYALWDKNDHWEFDTYKNSFHPEGVQTFSFSNGIFKFRKISGASIDNVNSHTLGYSTDTTSKKIEMRLKWNVADASNLRTIVSVWTDKVAQYPTASELSYNLSEYGNAPEDFVTIVLDGTNFKYFDNNILERLRFYPINLNGECEIDYIRFVGSEANVLTSGNYKADSQAASYIVPSGSTIAPQGVAVWNELHLAGGIDFTNGIAIVKNRFESASNGNYKAFVLDMDAENLSVVDSMYVDSTNVPAIHGATYLMPANSEVTFERKENTSGITMTVDGASEVFIGDENPVYTATFDGDITDNGVMWSVDRADVATVDENGVLTAIKDGTVRLTAVSVVDSSINASINITVSRHVFTLTLEGEENIVVDDNAYSYKAYFNGDVPQNTAVKFSTDNKSVASIDAESGELTINGVGRVTVIATSVYDYRVTAELTVNIRYADFELSIEGRDVIIKDGRSEIYTVVKNGKHTGKMTYTWTVSDTKKAAISAEGKLTPKDNGEVTIRATSNYNPKIYAEKTITLTNQSGLYSITYHTGTQDVVTGMPETEYGKKNFTLSDTIPERNGYYFMGWTNSEDSIQPITEINVNSDVDVYALWGKGINYEFNDSLDGVTWIMNGAGTLSGDGYLIVNAYGETRLFMKAMSIDPKWYQNIEIRLSHDSRNYVHVFYTTETDNPDGSVTKTGYSENGYRDAERLSLTRYHNANGLGNWVDLKLPMYSAIDYPDLSKENMWYKASADRITGLWIDICGNRAGTVYVDYIRIPDLSRNIIFDADTDDAVTGMPENSTVAFGSKVSLNQKPEREGYRFMGFSQTPGDAENIISSVVVRDDMTLYAVWRKIYTAQDNIIEIDTFEREDGDAVLVKASAKASLVLTLDTKNGSETLYAEANSSGNAYFDISDMQGANNLHISVDSEGGTVYDAIIVTKSLAEKSGNTNVVINPENAPPKNYDNTVTTIVSDKPLYNADKKKAEEEAVKTPDYSGITEPILINFDKPEEKNLFGDYQFAEFASMKDSILELGVKTKSDASVETAVINVDAETHPYVIVKMRGQDISTLKVGFNFLTDTANVRYITSNNRYDYATGDWDVLVYDMSECASWKGVIENLRFTFAEPVDDSFFIDWILLTDTIPENFDEIKGAKTFFDTVNSGDFPFEDVTMDDWFYSKVRTIWRIGFVNGVTESSFEPEGNVTAAQAITLAVRIKHRLENKDAVLIPEDGEAWYEPYVREALKYKIIKMDQFENYNEPISRKACVDVLYRALPARFFKAINYYGTVPGMNESDKEHNAVLKMYDAGILTGRDGNHEFFPDSNITRAEISTVIVRMVNESDRERIITAAERERNKITFTGEDIVNNNCYFYECKPTKPVLDGTIAVTRSTAVADPIVYLTNLYTFDQNTAAYYTKVRIGMKWDTSVVSDPVAYGCSIFFTTENETGHSADKSIKATWNGKIDENGIGEFVFDLTKNEKASDIRNFRFDPFDAKNCEFGIAYIIIE